MPSHTTSRIFVIGGTGAQGLPVIGALVADKKYSVRALSRDLASMANPLSMDRTTLTRNLRPLEAMGLIAIRQDPGDRRIRALALTAKGRGLLSKAVPLWRKAQSDSTRRIGPNRWQALRPALNLLSA